jgi:AraC-like DNA-binding protein
MLCALVPVVYHERCLAVVRLVCPASFVEENFERHVELLDVLVKGFVISEADFLGQLMRPEGAAVELGAPPSLSTGSPVEQRPSHPQVLRALQYIEDHLSDPKLTVGGVAHKLDLHPDYLSHLFAEQVGQRMSRFIAARRVERAKTLLATTDWQVKRIARETGHANPNWFCHVFSVHIGLAPGRYRRESRAASDRYEEAGLNR